MKWLINTFSFWNDLRSEIRIWWIFRTTCRNKTNLQKLNDLDLRVDWLGRIYGVVNMPEEVQTAAPQIQQAYVMKELGKWGPITNELGISDIVFPEMQRIDGTAAYLIIMWPQYDALGLWSILGNLIRTAIVGFGIFLLARVIWINFHHVTELFNKLLGLAGI